MMQISSAVCVDETLDEGPSLMPNGMPSGPYLEMEAPQQKRVRAADIRVFGIGGGGTNLTNHMIEVGVEDVEFIAVNTDMQDLMGKSRARHKIAIGKKITGGRGAGGRPDVGEKAANEDRESILECVKGADMVFVCATMGGGTGTGAAPVIAALAKEEGALTVGIVTKPFTYEGPHKMELAEEGIKKLRESVDTLIVIPNQNIFNIVDRRIKAMDAYLKANDILRFGVQGISDIITKQGFVNTDFTDVANTMRDQGDALFGIGEAEGENRAVEAANKAISNPLFEDAAITGATHILVNLASSEELEFGEIEEAINTVRSGADVNVDLIHGITFDPMLGNSLRVTVVATGFTPVDNAAQKDNGIHVAKPQNKDWISTTDWDRALYGGAKPGVQIGTQPSYLGPRNQGHDELETPTLWRMRNSEREKEQMSGPQSTLGLFGARVVEKDAK